MTSASLNCNPNVICNESTFGCSFNDGLPRDSKLTTELNEKLMTEPSDAMEATVKVKIPHKRGHPKVTKTPGKPPGKPPAKGGVCGQKINSRTINMKKRVTAPRSRKKKGSDALSDDTIMLLKHCVCEDEERNVGSSMIQEHQRMLMEDAMQKPESLQADLRKHEQDIAQQDTGTQNPKEYDVQHGKPNEKFGIDIGKQEGNCKRTLLQVHDIVPSCTSAPYDYAHHGTISFNQMNSVIQWGQHLFMKRFWL